MCFSTPKIPTPTPVPPIPDPPQVVASSVSTTKGKKKTTGLELLRIPQNPPQLQMGGSIGTINV